MFAGFAGGIQPWWHHVGAYHDDRRMYRTAEPVMRWHNANERYLVTARRWRASAWSGRSRTPTSSAATRRAAVDAPYTGFMHALVRAPHPVPAGAHRRHRARGGLARRSSSRTWARSRTGRPRGSAASSSAARRSSRPGNQPVRRVGRRAPGLRAGRHLCVPPEGDTPRLSAGAVAGAVGPRRCSPGRGGHTYLRLTPELARGSTGRRATSRPSPASVTRCFAASTRPTSSPYGGTLTPLRVEPGRWCS